MALFTESAIRQRARQETGIYKSAKLTLESLAAFAPTKTYDIFLSHSIRDADLILGMKGTLEDLGYSVYVDWIDDPQLDRSNVTPATAEKLREKMNSSKSLFYITTSNSDSSRWMPWECGFFDGKKEKVAIVPIQESSNSNSYSGQEYLGLYPYVVKEMSRGGAEKLYVRKSNSRYIDYDSWVKTANSQITWNQG